ncbi:MAG: hypothetical protein ACOY0T_27545 [Myxococcota bacterium]
MNRASGDLTWGERVRHRTHPAQRVAALSQHHSDPSVLMAQPAGYHHNTDDGAGNFKKAGRRFRHGFHDTKPRLSGRVDLASGDYYTRFDNLKVEKIADRPALYSRLLDNLEMLRILKFRIVVRTTKQLLAAQQ